nr:uncharacterized protein LOC109167433 [Ipomoea batatas]
MKWSTKKHSFVSVSAILSLFTSNPVPVVSNPVSNPLCIRDVSQYVDQAGIPVLEAELSIPVTAVADHLSLDFAAHKEDLNFGSYSPWLVPEFYTNLQEDADALVSMHYHEVFIRHKWYSFSPAVINKFLNRSSSNHSINMNADLLAFILTHNQVLVWSKTGLQSQNLTAIYSIASALGFYKLAAIDQY